MTTMNGTDTQDAHSEDIPAGLNTLSPVGGTWPEKKEIAYLILETDHFIVFLDEKNDVDWATRDTYKVDIRGKREQGKALVEVAYLQGLPTGFLREDQHLAFRRMLGEAVAHALNEDYKSSQRMLILARDYAEGRGLEVARIWYLSGSTLASLTMMVAWCICWCLRAHLNTPMTFVLFAMFAGSLGALYSVLLRLRTIQLEPTSRPKMHYIEGAARIGVGALGALLVGIAVRLKVLGFLPGSGDPSLLNFVFVGFIAGASERLAPSLIEKTTATSSGTTDK